MNAVGNQRGLTRSAFRSATVRGDTALCCRAMPAVASEGDLNPMKRSGIR